MRRIQTHGLLIAALVFGVVGCTKTETKANPKSVAEYLHDIDSAKAAVKEYAKDAEKNRGNPDYANAGLAVYRSSLMSACFPQVKEGIRFSTANTKHDCLDAKGYKR